MSYILVNSQKISVKIAITDQEQRAGLMHCALPTVMAFPYSIPKVRRFWMMNTPLPLEIVFCANDKVVEICQGIPNSLKTVGSDLPCDLVVEFPAGETKKLGIKAGTNISLNYDLESCAKSYHQFLKSSGA